MDVIFWCAASAVLTGIVVFALAQRGRRELEQEQGSLRSSTAVSDARLADALHAQEKLTAAHRELSDEYRLVCGERERLLTSLAKLGEDLEREAIAGSALRVSLDNGRENAARLDTESRVAKATSAEVHHRCSQLEQLARTAAEENRQQAERVATLTASAAAMSEQRDGLRVRLAEQKTWIEEQTRFFEERISSITGKLLEERSRTFTEVNRKELDAVVTPFKEQLAEFRQRVDHIHSSDSRDRGELHQQILQLTNLNQTVSRRAEDLTNALTITSKATGDWGETILQKILEDSGLREDREYVLQHSMTGAEGDTQQPDAVIFLPEQRQVVVDAKVSNKAWKDYCSSHDENERGERLKAHMNSLRAHIKGLSSKDYSGAPGLQTVDFVLMFVPVEAALLTALAHDDSLYTDAYRSKIVLVTPSTLMAVIKLIEGIWVFQKRKESADEIAEAGRKLFEKLSTFSNSFIEIGEAIAKAHGTFEKAKGQLSSGKGNAIKLAQRMVELGVSPAPGKVIRVELLESTQEFNEEESGPGQGSLDG